MAQVVLTDGLLTATNATSLQAAAKASKTFNHTAALSDVTITAKTNGYWGNSVQVRFVDPGWPSQALSVDVQGKIITVNLATDSSSVITSTGAQVVAAIAASTAAAALVDAADEGDGSGVCNALAIAALTGGLDGIVTYEGAKLRIKSINTDGLSATVNIVNDRNRDLVYPSEFVEVLIADLITATT